MSVKETAVEYHVKGFNCSQSVLCSCKEYTGMDEKTAAKLLASSGKNVKTAVVMHRKKVTKAEAEKLLKKQNGFLTKVIDG